MWWHTFFLNESVVKFYAGLHSKRYITHWSKTPIFIGLLDPNGQGSTVKSESPGAANFVNICLGVVEEEG